MVNKLYIHLSPSGVNNYYFQIMISDLGGLGGKFNEKKTGGYLF